MNRAFPVLVAALLLTTAGCAALERATPTDGGQINAIVVDESPDTVTAASLASVDNEYLRRAVERAIAAFENNETATLVVVGIPNPDMQSTRRAYGELPMNSTDSADGPFVTHRGHVVKVVLAEYS
jgi:hypothetical protein